MIIYYSNILMELKFYYAFLKFFYLYSMILSELNNFISISFTFFKRNIKWTLINTILRILCFIFYFLITMECKF